jgi:hypothetical protein
MNRITIKYSISRTVALTEGRAEFGESTYQPTDTALQVLSLDDRKYLDTLNLDRITFELPTGAPPTWPNIVESIKVERQKAIDKAAAEHAEYEREIVAVLSKPDEEWISEYNKYHDGIFHKRVDLIIPSYHDRCSWMQQDPRVVARVAALQPEFARRQIVANEQNEQAKARHEAAEAAKIVEDEQAAAEKQAAIDELDVWCVANGPSPLQRAANEGYDVAGGCVQWIAEQLRGQMPDPVHCTIIRDNTKLWNRYEWNERKSPNSNAFDLLDAVKNAVAELPRPSSVLVQVERIMYVEVEPPEDCYDDSKREFTAVIVNVTHPAAARRCLVVEVKE